MVVVVAMVKGVALPFVGRARVCAHISRAVFEVVIDGAEKAARAL